MRLLTIPFLKLIFYGAMRQKSRQNQKRKAAGLKTAATKTNAKPPPFAKGAQDGAPGARFGRVKICTASRNVASTQSQASQSPKRV